MSQKIFRVPCWPDRELIGLLHAIATEVPIKDAKLYFVPFDGASPTTIPFDQRESNPILQPLLDFGEASVLTLSLLSGQNHLLTVHRKGDSLFDEVTLNWDSNTRNVVPENAYARLIAIAKQKLKEVKISEAFSGFPNNEISSYYEARDATLTRLEAINRELLYGIHQRQKELDKEYKEKNQALEEQFVEARANVQKEFDTKELALKDKEDAFKKKESEFETRESKYLRRQLRQDMLKRLADLSQKFELTKGTRRLRWPIAIVTGIFVGFFGVLTFLAFSQAVQLLELVGQDLSKLNWWVLGLLSLKQIAFASAFLAGVWFLIKWSDRWFRQHADAEFNFKNLELDINRASWVVEMALEWKDEKGTELPAELLDRLTKNLFKEVSQPGGDSEAPTDVASVLLGSASKVKFKAGEGTEVELDRKGIKSAMKES